MVNWMTVLRDYFRKQISTVAVASYASYDGWYMGEFMDFGNYLTFQSDWERWGGLMTADGQLVSLCPFVGYPGGSGSGMLTGIASMSGMDIFASANAPALSWDWIDGDEINPSIWNQNQMNVWWGGRPFQFTTTGEQNYRWILYN